MRKIMSALIAVVMAFGIAGTASAAATTQSAPIKVLLNGTALKFEADPVQLNNTTYVEFRSLFTALGYEVKYDPASQTVFADSGYQSIEMSLKQDSTIVNGEKVPSAGAIKVIKNRTMVGVRFVASLSGKDVKWDQKSRTVTVKDYVPSAAQKNAIFAVFDKMIAAQEKRDAKALTALFEAGFPVEDLIAGFERTVRQTKITSKEIVSFSPKQAIVRVETEVRRVSGAFSPDVDGVVDYILVPGTGGSWLIYDMIEQYVEVVNPEKLFDQAVQVPEAEAKAIEQALKDQFKAIDDENLDALAELLKHEEYKADILANMKTEFEQGDASFEVGRTAIVEYDAEEGYALIVYTSTTTWTEDGQTYKTRYYTVNDVNKIDGKWVAAWDSETLVEEAIE